MPCGGTRLAFFFFFCAPVSEEFHPQHRCCHPVPERQRIRTVTTMPNVEVMQKTHAYTNVVNELVGTEQDYVRDLEFLIGPW